MDHCCFAGCKLVQCGTCQKQYCATTFHTCEIVLCEIKNCIAGRARHLHDETGRVLWECSWHPGEFHNICSEAVR